MLEWEEEVNHKIYTKQRVDLLKDLPIKRDLWLKNFVKSALSTSLIALAFNFMFTGFYAHDEMEILLGVVAFLIGLLIIFVIDTYHQKVRHLELLAINSNQELTDKHIDEVVEKVIKEKLSEVLKNDESLN